MVGKYLRKSPGYLATAVQGFLDKKNKYQLLNDSDIYELIQKTGSKATWSWNARCGRVELMHGDRVCQISIGEMIVWDMERKDFQVWAEPGFGQVFEHVTDTSKEVSRG